MYRLVVFDVDGVLFNIDSIWRYLHNFFGTWSMAKENMKLFFKGKLSYREWAELDAKLWKGFHLNKFYSAIEKIEVKGYAAELVKYIKDKGLKTIAISAGLDLLKHRLEKEIGIDMFISNSIVFQNNICTGKVIVRVEYSNKDKVLKDFCLKENIPLHDVITIGDSEVDIPMFKISGLSIAYNPKSLEVAISSNITVFSEDLKVLIEILERII